MPYLNETHATGWMPDRYDERDWMYSDTGTSDPLPSVVDLTEYLHITLLQGDVPSCVGHAIAHQIIIEEAQVGLRDSIPARAYIYAMARTQHQDELEKTGTYPRLAYRGISKYGCPPELWWKYDTRGDWLNKKPGFAAKRQAASRMGLEYYRITGDRVGKIKALLADGHPVTIGTRVTDHIRDYKNGEIVHAPHPTEKLGGGHYMLIVGYDGDKFLIVNSWKGSERMWFDESMIEWYQSGDFYTITGWACLGETNA